MKKCINGCVVQMPAEEVQHILHSQFTQIRELTPEERLEKLEKGIAGLEALLEKLRPVLGL